jgi:Pyruvate/2-oxoacid:ferredoxin oxidoreductase delta subunit
VTNVIHFNNKLQHSRDKKAALNHKRKLLAVQKVFQCAHCAFKCEKCGTQINPDERDNISEKDNIRVPYRFCEGCSEEYIDYIERLHGRGDPDCYWHNEAWLEAWRRWIDYQGVIDRYLKSKEFVQLLKELKETRSD